MTRTSRRLRFASGMLALAAILAGCAGNNANNGSNASSASGTSKAEETASASPQAAESGELRFDKKLNLSYWYSHGSDIPAISNPKENVPGTWLEEKTGVHLKEAIGNGGQDPIVKLGMMVAGNMLPNIAFSSNQIGFDKALEGNLLWELTPETLQKYAPDVWASIPSYAWDAVKKDGKIYGIPFDLQNTLYSEVEGKSADWLSYYGPAPQSVTWSSTSSSSGFLIRDDILKQLYPDALDYEEAMKLIGSTDGSIAEKFILPIKTTDDYVKLMYNIKNLNLKVNNRPVYAFGYPKGDNWTALTALGSEMVGYKSYNYMTMYNSKENKLEFGLMTPAVKKAAQLQNQMIRDEVIDPESIVHTSEQFQEKLLSGQYAITSVLETAMVGIGNLDKLNEMLKDNGADFQYVPLFTQIPNLPEYPAQYVVPVSGGANSYMWLLKTIAEEDLPQVLNWFNTFFTDEYEEIKYWGPAELGLYTEENGVRAFKDATLQQGLIEGDSSIDARDLKGFYTRSPDNLFFEIKRYPTEWSYEFMYRNTKKNIINAMTKFPSTSPYATSVIKMPEMSTWKADFKDIPEVTDLLNARADWEDAFKYALIAKNDTEFEKKWQEAIKTLQSDADIDQLLEKQWQIFEPALSKLEARD
ncbi:type 2 periplasmic-binding domain-containing protein [Cohnella fermenti]|uniref:Extracellular solute-binding protein n=1 Tax=Cohnella fermenti TaxID=2565925 RepID=A0A4S4BYV0_9BACL|nr:hypothetical protein [Cohnella fermenti]THF80351.1 hypothetical protein E6C55_10735 [Cohnella fermenti]